MQSADKTTIKAKVMHVCVSTTVLANDIQILRFISYRDSERELMPYLEATASISFSVAMANVLTSRLSLNLFLYLCHRQTFSVIYKAHWIYNF